MIRVKGHRKEGVRTYSGEARMKFPCGEWLKHCPKAKMRGSSPLRFAKEILEGEPSIPKTPVKWLGKVSYREMV